MGKSPIDSDCVETGMAIGKDRFNDLITIFGIRTIKELIEVGKVISIDGNGNCLYAASNKGLQDLHVDVPTTMTEF